MSTSVGGGLGHGEPSPSPGDAGYRRHAIVPDVGPSRGDAGMTHGASFWFPASRFRDVAAVLRRPRLWLTALRQLTRAVPRRWWARAPFVPLPDRAYLRFRIETAYGVGGRPRADDVVRYLEWCRAADHGAGGPVTGTLLPQREVVTVVRALLLNASFEPLCVVSSRRAVVLVLKEKAEIVHRNGAEFHSERRVVPVPTVIRLVHFVRVPFRATAPLSRRAVFARDNHRCQYCGTAAENLDHVLPRFAGRAPHLGERRGVVPGV